MRWPAAVALVVLGAASATLAAAQEAPLPAPSPMAPPVVADVPPPLAPEDQERDRRRGRFRLGPLYVSPRFEINSIGYDNNVLYTPTDRRSDVSARGGPGLEVILPVGHASALSARGQLDYVHYVRTASQRHLAGGVTLLADRTTPRSQFSLSHARLRSYQRPSFEVDERVVEDRRDTVLSIRQRVLGRIGVRGGGGFGGSELPPGQEFLGVDLRQTMQNEHWHARGGLEYTLTVKTRALVEAERVHTRFPLTPLRDGAQDEIRGGLETDSTALVSGRLVFGRGWFRPDVPTVEEASFTTADVDATLHISPRTHIGVGFEQGLQYSALARTGSPKLRTRRYSAHAEKELLWRLDLRLTASLTQLRNEGSVDITTSGGVVSGSRRDTAREASADLGYRFRSKLRMGVRTSYAERDSTFDYFAIEGLMVGVTVTYEP